MILWKYHRISYTREKRRTISIYNCGSSGTTSCAHHQCCVRRTPNHQYIGAVHCRKRHEKKERRKKALSSHTIHWGFAAYQPVTANRRCCFRHTRWIDGTHVLPYRNRRARHNRIFAFYFAALHKYTVLNRRRRRRHRLSFEWRSVPSPPHCKGIMSFEHSFLCRTAVVVVWAYLPGQLRNAMEKSKTESRAEIH